VRDARGFESAVDAPADSASSGVRPGATAGAVLLVVWLVAMVLWWGFAFVPGNAAPDSWIAAARAACFGSTPDGLPAGYGWMLLVGAPLMLFGVMCVAFGEELRGGWQLLSRSTAWRLVAIVLATTFVAEVGWAAIQVDRAFRVSRVSFEPLVSEGLPPHYPRLAQALPEFDLVDQTGAPFDQTMLRGTPTVVSFVFAHCQTVCPVLAQNTKKAIARIGEDRVRLVLVTLDPWRDTPAALASLAEHWGLPGNARLLSGDPERVGALLDAFDVARERNETNGDVVHPPLVYLVDGEGRVAYRFNNPPVDWIVEGVSRLAEPS